MGRSPIQTFTNMGHSPIWRFIHIGSSLFWDVHPYGTFTHMGEYHMSECLRGLSHTMSATRGRGFGPPHFWLILLLIIG